MCPNSDVRIGTARAYIARWYLYSAAHSSYYGENTAVFRTQIWCVDIEGYMFFWVQRGFWLLHISYAPPEIIATQNTYRVFRSLYCNQVIYARVGAIACSETFSGKRSSWETERAFGELAWLCLKWSLFLLPAALFFVRQGAVSRLPTGRFKFIARNLFSIQRLLRLWEINLWNFGTRVLWAYPVFDECFFYFFRQILLL